MDEQEKAQGKAQIYNGEMPERVKRSGNRPRAEALREGPGAGAPRRREQENALKMQILGIVLGVLILALIAAIVYEVVLGYGTRQTGNERMAALREADQAIQIYSDGAGGANGADAGGAGDAAGGADGEAAGSAGDAAGGADGAGTDDAADGADGAGAGDAAGGTDGAGTDDAADGADGADADGTAASGDIRGAEPYSGAGLII